MRKLTLGLRLNQIGAGLGRLICTMDEDFSTGIGTWVFTGPGSIVSWDSINKRMKVDVSPGPQGAKLPSLIIEQGETYTFSFFIQKETDVLSSIRIYPGANLTGTPVEHQITETNGIVTFEYIATSNELSIYLRTNGEAIFYYDDFKIC